MRKGEGVAGGCAACYPLSFTPADETCHCEERNSTSVPVGT
ncbi:MAG: hypothetical protein WCJ95_21380 [Mariniphaga sp.]